MLKGWTFKDLGNGFVHIQNPHGNAVNIGYLPKGDEVASNLLRLLAIDIMKTTNDGVQKITDTFNSIEEKKKKIELIKTAVAISAKSLRWDAGMGGRMDDGGAHEAEEQLRYWLDGYEFNVRGVTVVYNDILKDAAMKADPDYSTYLKLKEKFEK